LWNGAFLPHQLDLMMLNGEARHYILSKEFSKILKSSEFVGEKGDQKLKNWANIVEKFFTLQGVASAHFDLTGEFLLVRCRTH